MVLGGCGGNRTTPRPGRVNPDGSRQSNRGNLYISASPSHPESTFICSSSRAKPVLNTTTCRCGARSRQVSTMRSRLVTGPAPGRFHGHVSVASPQRSPISVRSLWMTGLRQAGGCGQQRFVGSPSGITSRAMVGSPGDTTHLGSPQGPWHGPTGPVSPGWQSTR